MSETVSTELYEVAQDAGSDDPGLVRLWLEAIDLARKTEKDWMKRAEAARSRYRDEEKRTARRFNILYANTQITLPSLYNSTPIPDVRRRFDDADPAGKVASQIIERAVTFSADEYDMDTAMRATVFDMILAGRGVARVRYEPQLGEGDAIVGQQVSCEHVQWTDFIRGPGRAWENVSWIGFEHRFTREELAAQFGDIGQTMPLDVVVADDRRGHDPRDVPDVFKRGTVYELWDKQGRQVLFIAPTVMESPLRRVDDPLGLKSFFPIPRPICDVMDSGSLVPIVPYELYRDQADELDRVTARITVLVQMCKVRGLRDASVQEFSQLADAKDGDFVPVENAAQYLATTGGGGLERAMWMMPIDTVSNVIVQLVAHREQIKATIYEITGLSDILRGATNAQETARAQEIKAQTGSLRIQDRQREVQRFARDLIRMQAQIIAEKFEPHVLSAMTGVELPTGEQKQMAMQALQVLGQQAQEPPPELVQTAETPSWDEVMGILRSDAMRGYRVDIETDSTIQADVSRAKANAAEFVQGFGGFIQAVGPAVQAGFMPMDVAADLLTAFARQFKLGRQAEDALDRLSKAKPPQPQGQGGEVEMMKAQAAQQKAQADMQITQAKTQGILATTQAKTQASMAEHQMGMERLQAETQAAAFLPNVRSVM